MKPNLRNRVAGFVVCFVLTAGISSSNAQEAGGSPLPPADINTSSISRLLPPIVSSDFRHASASSEVPIVQGNPTAQSFPPIVGAGNALTPKISSEVAQPDDSAIQQTSGNQLNDRYSIQSAGQIITQPIGGPVPLSPRTSVPPIIQKNPLAGNPLLNNPLGTPMRSQPSFIQASSPFPRQDDNAATDLPGEEQASSASSPVSPLAMESMDNTSSVIEMMPEVPLAGTIMQTPMASPCVGCASGCNDCGNVASPTTIIGRNFLRPATNFATPVAGCNSCGDVGCSSCVGSSTSACSSCGTNGCYNVGEVDKRFAACGFISRARSYFIMDVLYMTRANGEVNGINLSAINEFDYGFGARFTVGRRTDAANGREFSYFGSFDIEDGGNVADPAGRIRRRFVPDGTFITDADVSAFSNVTSASERLETNFQSFEYNRVRWGWDVVKVIFGARYVYLEDDYDLTTTNIFAENGSLSVDAKNHMIGPQVGLEMFYDVGFRWSLSGFGKFGLMLNAYDADVSASSDGFGITNSGTNDADLGFLVDLGLTAHYQLSSRARFRVGYNLLFLGDVTTADEAFPTFLSPFSSNSLDAEDDALFSGVSLGLEFYR